MKTTIPDISYEGFLNRTLNCMRRKFLEIAHDKNDPDRSANITKYTNEIAKFVDRMDKHYEQQHKKQNNTNEKKTQNTKELTNPY